MLPSIQAVTQVFIHAHRLLPQNAQRPDGQRQDEIARAFLRYTYKGGSQATASASAVAGNTEYVLPDIPDGICAVCREDFNSDPLHLLANSQCEHDICKTCYRKYYALNGAMCGSAACRTFLAPRIFTENRSIPNNNFYDQRLNVQSSPSHSGHTNASFSMQSSQTFPISSHTEQGSQVACHTQDNYTNSQPQHQQQLQSQWCNQNDQQHYQSRQSAFAHSAQSDYAAQYHHQHPPVVQGERQSSHAQSDTAYQGNHPGGSQLDHIYSIGEIGPRQTHPPQTRTNYQHNEAGSSGHVQQDPIGHRLNRSCTAPAFGSSGPFYDRGRTRGFS